MINIISLIVGIIGAGVTIFAARFARKQAGEARESATTAEKMKQSIEREYRKIELGKLLNSTKNTMEQTINLMTPANPEKKVNGLNYDNIISVLRRFIDNLKENSHYLPGVKGVSIGFEYKNIESLISELAAERDQQKKYKIGDKIHKCVGEILRIIKPETDIK